MPILDELFQSPTQVLGPSPLAPPAPDIGGASLQALRALLGQQFLASRANVPPTLEEVLGMVGPHAGLLGKVKASEQFGPEAMETLRKLISAQRGKVAQPWPGLSPTVKPIVEQFVRRKTPYMPWVTADEGEAVASILGKLPHTLQEILVPTPRSLPNVAAKVVRAIEAAAEANKGQDIAGMNALIRQLLDR